MKEALYKRLIGYANPKQPRESLQLQLKMLRFLGLWPPETDNKYIQMLYGIHSILYRGIFLYFYSFCQAMYFKNVEELKDVADALFLLITQISLIYRVEIFYKNQQRIKVMVDRLNTELFCPTNTEEDSAVKSSMYDSVLFFIGYMTPCYSACTSWAIIALLSKGEIPLPIPAWYPFNYRPQPLFSFMFIFQVYGIFQSASFSIAADTLVAALLFHARAQVDRLGIMLSNVGYSKNLLDKKEFDPELKDIESTVSKIKRKHGENYGQLVRCIIFHDKVLEFIMEIEDIFKSSIFCQLMFSSLIICMTMLLMANQSNIADLFASASYLMAMIVQIFLCCWASNEVMWTSQKLVRRAYHSNFPDFDQSTSKTLRIFMLRLTKNIEVKCGSLFKIKLSLLVFMSILKSSYSYFAVLYNVQHSKNI